MKQSVLVAIALIFTLAAAASSAEWEYLSMAGEQCLCISADRYHPRVLVGTIEGFHYLDQPSGLWTNRDWDGWIGREVHAILGHRSYDGWIITGRENAFWKGYLEVTEDLGVTEVFSYESTGGAIVALTQRGHGVDHRLYACGISDIVPGEFLVSEDGGYTWTPSSTCPHYWMSGLGVGTGGQVFVSGEDMVWSTGDHGATWNDARGNLPGIQVDCLAVEPHAGDMLYTRVYAGNATGLYTSTDLGDYYDTILAGGIRKVAVYPGADVIVAAITYGGQIKLSYTQGVIWTDETGNLPGTPVDLSFSNEDGHLYVVTQTDGVFRTPIDPTSAPDIPLEATARLSAWPNPFNPKTQVLLRLGIASSARVTVHDLRGREVAVLFEGFMEAGEQSLTWDATGLPSGVYLARLDLGGESPAASTKLVLLQ